MSYREYKRIYHQLRSFEAIEKLAERTRFDRELLFVLYTQKTIRDITKNYYRVKHKTKRMRNAWNNGTPLVKIAKQYNFSPVLITGFVLRANGYTKRMVKDAIRDPDSVTNRRIRREVHEVLEADKVYSPEGNRIQAERGVRGEAFIADWLDHVDIEYQTEEDMRGKFPKTPDFYFPDNGLHIRGTKLHWIESKGSFGDKVEFKRNMKKQLSPYRELFGEGMVIYHFGFVSNLPLEEGILVETPDALLNWRK